MQKSKLFSLVLFLVTGCASMENNQIQNVKITSDPAGATVIINKEQKQTPAIFDLHGTPNGYDVIVMKEGYKTVKAHLHSSFLFKQSVLGNAFWIAPGLICDISSGTAFQLQPQLHFILEKY